MQRYSDAQLLLDYAQTGSEDAFREIVRRHAGLVYSAALRQIGSSDFARDITQKVFTALALKAASLSKKLSPESSIAGWLYRATRFESQDLRRSELRRASREQNAMKDAAHESEAVSPDWEPLRPCLDQAMAELTDADRDAILLRFFQNQTLRDVGAALGVSDDAAQKRISRALERLRRSLSRSGAEITASALSVALTTHSLRSVPSGLAQSISAAALNRAASATALTTTTNSIAMTTTQKALIGTAFALLVGTGLYQVRQNSRLQDEVHALQAAETQLSAKLQQAKSENARLAQLAAQAETAASQSSPASNELLKLRGAASLNAREIAQLKAALSDRAERLPESVATLMTSYLGSLRTAENEFQENEIAARLAKMSANLTLSPAQQEQVRDILSSKVAARTELEVAAETGTLPFEEVKARRNKVAREEEQAIAAVLTPDQLTAYQEMQNQEDAPGIKNWAYREASRMAASLNLTPEQRDQAATLLNNLKPGEGGQRLALYSNASDQLALRMQALQSLLTEKQAQSYLHMLQHDVEEHELLARISQAMEKSH